MRFDLISIFPEFFAGPLAAGVVGRARARGQIDVRVHDLRDFADPPRRSVDDQAYGGGPGMVFRPEPAVRALTAVREAGEKAAVVWPTPVGELLSQGRVRELGEYEQIVVLCDRYEGSDARISRWVTHEVSIGDFILSGGELAALVVVDAVARLAPGVVGEAESVEQDSFSRSLLDHRAFTRPQEYAGSAVPAVLASGDHGRIAAWRERDAVRRTLERRPDLLDGAPLLPPVQDLLGGERRFERGPRPMRR